MFNTSIYPLSYPLIAEMFPKTYYMHLRHQMQYSRSHNYRQVKISSRGYDQIVQIYVLPHLDSGKIGSHIAGQ